MGTSLSRPMVPTRGRRSSGFTILELLILMVVLGIAASVGIPSYFSRPDVTLKSAAELLANDLREVGGRAAVYRSRSVSASTRTAVGTARPTGAVSSSSLPTARRRVRSPLRRRRRLPRRDHRGARAGDAPFRDLRPDRDGVAFDRRDHRLRRRDARGHARCAERARRGRRRPRPLTERGAATGRRGLPSGRRGLRRSRRRARRAPRRRS